MDHHAYIIAGVDVKTLKVTAVDILSEPASSASHRFDMLLLDVIAVPGTSFANAHADAKALLQKAPQYAELYKLYLQVGRR